MNGLISSVDMNTVLNYILSSTFWQHFYIISDKIMQ